MATEIKYVNTVTAFFKTLSGVFKDVLDILSEKISKEDVVTLISEFGDQSYRIMDVLLRAFESKVMCPITNESTLACQEAEDQVGFKDTCQYFGLLKCPLWLDRSIIHILDDFKAKFKGLEP